MSFLSQNLVDVILLSIPKGLTILLSEIILLLIGSIRQIKTYDLTIMNS